VNRKRTLAPASCSRAISAWTSAGVWIALMRPNSSASAPRHRPRPGPSHARAVENTQPPRVAAGRRGRDLGRRLVEDRVQRGPVPLVQLVEAPPRGVGRRNGVGLEPAAVGELEEVLACRTGGCPRLATSKGFHLHRCLRGREPGGRGKGKSKRTAEADWNESCVLRRSATPRNRFVAFRTASAAARGASPSMAQSPTGHAAA